MRNGDLLIDSIYVLALVVLSIGGVPEQCGFEYDLTCLVPSQERLGSDECGWKGGFGLVSGGEWSGVGWGGVGRWPGVLTDTKAMPPPGG